MPALLSSLRKRARRVTTPDRFLLSPLLIPLLPPLKKLLIAPPPPPPPLPEPLRRRPPKPIPPPLPLAKPVKEKKATARVKKHEYTNKREVNAAEQSARPREGEVQAGELSCIQVCTGATETRLSLRYPEKPDG